MTERAEGNLIFLDTETTGLPAEAKASVIEVGAVAYSPLGSELGRFSSLVRPVFPLGAYASGAMAVNNIDPALLEVAPSTDEVWAAMVEWMALHAPIGFVTAFNVEFDKEMMLRSFPLSEHFPWGPCVMRTAAAKLTAGHSRISLVKSVERLGLPLAEERHRAVADARLAGQVWFKLQGL